MGLFKNEVGRPSNEVLKKRRIVAAVLIFIVVLAIGACVFYTVNYFKTAGSSKNISAGSIYTNISVKNNSSYIYVGNEKTKKGDFKVFSNNKLEIDLTKMISISPLRALSTIILNCFLFSKDVPDIPSSA